MTNRFSYRLAAAALLLAGLACADDLPGPDGNPEPSATLVGAGDIAVCGESAHEETARVLDTIPGTVFTAGDNAYPDGTAQQFADCYDPTWGRHVARTRPSPGNHDYNTPGGTAYFAYFGANAGNPGEGYYSYDLGSWHVIALNSNIDVDTDSPQLQWLRGDLTAHPALCTVAYWHHPRFSSGQHGNDDAMQPVWEALYEAGVEVVLNGHDHDYERFAPQTPTGTPDAVAGIRAFVVGTGGRTLRNFAALAAHSDIRNSETYGVLKLTLRSTGYDWDFIPAGGGQFVDAGSGTCHP